jgi:hypothetical protein
MNFVKSFGWRCLCVVGSWGWGAVFAILLGAAAAGGFAALFWLFLLSDKILPLIPVSLVSALLATVHYAVLSAPYVQPLLVAVIGGFSFAGIFIFLKNQTGTTPTTLHDFYGEDAAAFGMSIAAPIWFMATLALAWLVPMSGWTFAGTALFYFAAQFPTAMFMSGFWSKLDKRESMAAIQPGACLLAVYLGWASGSIANAHGMSEIFFTQLGLGVLVGTISLCAFIFQCQTTAERRMAGR